MEEERAPRLIPLESEGLEHLSVRSEIDRFCIFHAGNDICLTLSRIVVAYPLSAESQRNALKNIDRNISGQIDALGERLKTALPDELSILTKTNGWKTEDQQALVRALRAGDRTAV